MKKQILYLTLLLLPVFVSGQTLTIETCQKNAVKNYPLIKQFGLIEKTSEYNISNANKAYLPQLSIAAKATYQSEVTEIPSAFGEILSQLTGKPVSFPSLSKDQYQAVLEVNQLIWDGGMINAQKKSIKASTEADKQKLNVDLYSLKDRVNQLYFGILLINEQLIQIGLLQDELAKNYDRINAFKKNGVAMQSDVDAIKVEQLNARQKEVELKSTRKSFIQMLSAMTGLAVTENTFLEKPILPTTEIVSTNNRPELKFFEAQNNVLVNQKSAVYASNLPKVGLFAQGGYGRPGLNMFTGSFSTFYIGGIRLSWNISGLYSQKNNIDKIEVGQKSIAVQKETFLFNNNLLNQQQQNEITRLNEVIKNDDEIILLRNNIKKSAEAKVQNGTLTVTDLLREINAENSAKQTKALHEIQLYITIYQLKNNTNN